MFLETVYGVGLFSGIGTYKFESKIVNKLYINIVENKTSIILNISISYRQLSSK